MATRPRAPAGHPGRRAPRRGACRRHRRRADLARRPGRRLGHLRRLRPPQRASRWPSATCPSALADAGIGRLRDRDHRPPLPRPPPARAGASTPRACGCGRDRRLRRDAGGWPIVAGDTVALAALRAGEHPGHGGTLCLAGDCGSCVAEVDGVAWVRTCQTPARPGTVVRRHPDGGPPPALGDGRTRRRARRACTSRPTLVVVGAGQPAGRGGVGRGRGPGAWSSSTPPAATRSSSSTTGPRVIVRRVRRRRRSSSSTSTPTR